MTDDTTRAGLHAGFADLFEESDTDLEVQGTIPTWVCGALVRNGPAQWNMPESGRLNHWLDGLAMLHRFAISDGKVHYRNRWLQSRNRVSVDATGRNTYAQFDTDPKRSLWQKIATTVDFPLQFGNNDFITVASFDEEWVAVGETPTQLSIDIDTLATKGPFTFKDRMFSIWTCSHMIPDPVARRMYGFSTMGVPIFGRYQLWYVDGASRTRTKWATVKDRRPSWMHAFGLSEHYAVLTAFPLRCRTWQLFFNALIGKPFIQTFKWHDDEPTKGYLIERSSGRVVRRFELPPLFAFHFANTWEEHGEVVFDIAAYADASAIEAGRLNTVFGPDGGRYPSSTLQRFRVPVSGGKVQQQVLSDAPFEMPRINDGKSMRSYRYAYGFSYDAPGHFYNQLVKIDTQRTTANDTRWGPPGVFPSEPVFVPQDGATAEDDGVVLSVVLDVSGDEPTSWLVVLDATTFTELGRARVPHHIPFGLHGTFVPAERGTL